MKDWMTYMPVIFVCLPVLMTVLFYQVYVRIKGHKWKAIHFSAQCTVIFYIIADLILLGWMYSKNFLGIILIFLIVLLAIILIIQWKTKTEVLIKDGLIALSRLAFLIFAIGYVCLLLYVVISGYVA